MRLALAALALLTLTMPTAAQVPLTEYDCLRGTAMAVGRFATAQARCLLRCEQGARRGRNPVGDCTPPYAGRMLECMAHPVRGASAKLAAAIDRACADECPTCFGACEQWKSWVLGYAYSYLQNFDPQYHFCDDSSSPDGLTRREAMCLDTQTGRSAMLTAQTLGCYRHCVDDIEAGLRDPASCFAPSDAVASGCVTDPSRDPAVRTAQRIDRACTDPPECPPAPATGAEWAAGAESTADLLVFFMHCGSASGAFLD